MNLSSDQLSQPIRLKNIMAQQSNTHFTCISNQKITRHKKQLATRKPISFIKQLANDITSGWLTLVIIFITYIISINF